MNTDDRLMRMHVSSYRATSAASRRARLLAANVCINAISHGPRAGEDQVHAVSRAASQE